MSKNEIERHDILSNLGDGLVLRSVRREDTEALVAFNARIHGNIEEGELEERVGAWTRDLMEKPHPTFDIGDFTLVEETQTGKIVSSLCLISQTWSYGGIPFGVGRPEIVGTDREDRNRGLVRAQFDVIHQWSAERGQM
ncbi:MAG: GNAT family N-acetyltransferase, partial [Anaerolineales bacterium]|nr:GNAT family N-acetyltransferase [Anaerolineales bacterium]